MRSIFKYCFSNRHFLCQIQLCINAVLENLPQNRDNLLQYNKYILFLCNFMRPKTLDKNFSRKDLNQSYLLAREVNLQYNIHRISRILYRIGVLCIGWLFEFICHVRRMFIHFIFLFSLKEKKMEEKSRKKQQNMCSTSPKSIDPKQYFIQNPKRQYFFK